MKDLDIDFVQGSFDKLRRSAEKRSRLLNEDIKKTLTKTSLKVLTALRASARKSKEFRRIVRNKASGSKRSVNRLLRRHGHIQQWYQDHPDARHTSRQGDQLNKGLPRMKDIWDGSAKDAKYAIEKWRQRKSVLLIRISGAQSVKEAKEVARQKMLRQYKIMRRGLAKSSFTWMMGKLGPRSGSQDMQPEIPGATSVRKTATPTGGAWRLSIKMLNEISYILTSLSGGRRDVHTALERARSMLVYDTKRALHNRLKRAA